MLASIYLVWIFMDQWYSLCENPKLYLLTVSHSEQIFVVGSSWYFTKCIFGTSVIFLRQLQCCILQSNNVVLEVANENGDMTYNFYLIWTNLWALIDFKFAFLIEMQTHVQHGEFREFWKRVKLMSCFHVYAYVITFMVT